MRLRQSWSDLFPGRQINFEGHKPTVVSDYSPGGSGYPAQQMSDGERVALYLAGRVLDTASSILIIDEPEVHFHSKLAVRFWSEMESLRSDVRFVYITHDLPFALSRNDATFVIVMPNKDPHPVELLDQLPTELIETFLAAASFSIYAKRIVFCEGEEDKSLDWDLYSAWFNDKETALMPVGSGREVIQCVKTFIRSKIVSGVSALGIVDRDYYPNDFLESQPDEIYVLPYHEVECALCRDQIVKAVAIHLGKEAEDVDRLYSAFVSKARSRCTGGFLNKQISERFRRRCEFAIEAVLNTLKLDEDIEIVEQRHVEALDPAAWSVPATAIFAEERQRVEKAVAGDFEECLKLIPGKEFLGLAAEAVGMTREAYVELICSALSSSDNGHQALGKALEAGLRDILPARVLT